MVLVSFSKLDPDTQEEVILYVGESFNLTYQKRWASMEARSSKASWNWATFFLSLPWAAYRKMYAWTYGYFAVTSLIDLLFWIFKHKEGAILGLVEFLAIILFSIFSNYIYQQHAIKAVEKLKIVIPDKEQRHAYLRKKGGGSGASVWLFFLIAFIVGGIYGVVGIV